MGALKALGATVCPDGGNRDTRQCAQRAIVTPLGLTSGIDSAQVKTIWRVVAGNPALTSMAPK